MNSGKQAGSNFNTEDGKLPEIRNFKDRAGLVQMEDVSKKNISILILGMQAVGKSTIALRLYKFCNRDNVAFFVTVKRALPDTNYVQTKGFHTYSVKRKKTTINIYDIGGHPSIQELWDHYYADAHGIIFVVDTSDRDTVPEAGRLLSKVLSDHRIRGKPVLLLANKIDLEGVSESELDSMLNLQQLVNSVRCLTRLDVSCATDLKNDKGIFDGYKWLVSYIESNYLDLNNRVLSDSVEEKNREKARREAVKAAREAEKAEEEEQQNAQSSGTPTMPQKSPPIHSPILVATATPPKSASSRRSVEEEASIPNLVPDTEEAQHPQRAQPSENSLSSTRNFSPPVQLPKQETKTPDGMRRESIPSSKIPIPLLPMVNNVPSQLVEQPIKLPRLKSPKSRPEIINRIEDNGNYGGDDGSKKLIKNSNDQYYDEKGFRFRQISAARRLSPEGADSDDGIVNAAYEPNEDISSDSTPIGGRRHDFNGELEYKELFMVTTLAEVHKEYFKDRKGSTSTHDSVSMSVASEPTDSFNDDGQSGKVSLSKHDENIPLDNLSKKSSNKGKKKRLNIKSRHNKTAPLDSPSRVSVNPPLSVEVLRNFPSGPGSTASLPLDGLQNNQLSHNYPSTTAAALVKQSSRTSSASSKASIKAPFTVSNAWERNKEIPEHAAETPTANKADAKERY